ncbi:MAG: hypothetical protein A2V67_06165 [Deltaproteobacteria bacterium RBG_13_61_14]|nr:MAG: hypothetical protein A2V67_06165 [Deltaproteobacteria bacterium RBG_13_61_14]
MDAATLVAFDEGWEGLTLHCQRREGEQVNIRCQAMIAADGRFSSVVNTIDHSGQNGMKLFIAWQNLYEARCDIEPGF